MSHTTSNPQSDTSQNTTSIAPSITIIKNGPYVVTGHIPLSEDVLIEAFDGTHLQYNRLKDYAVGETYRLCRCGASKHMPFCDGAHTHAHTESGNQNNKQCESQSTGQNNNQSDDQSNNQNNELGGFDGTETASRDSYEMRTHIFDGENLELHDDKRCAFARLCHRRDGSVWEMMRNADANEQELIAASWLCPTGRLEHHDKQTGHVYEQTFEPSIVILEDPEKNASGPLFVRGGIPLIGADGYKYEVRNRYALCRCGASSDKPFCDARHWHIGFQDDSDAFTGAVGIRDESFIDKPKL